jgi:hypothetical protein
MDAVFVSDGAFRVANVLSLNTVQVAPCSGNNCHVAKVLSLNIVQVTSCSGNSCIVEPLAWLVLNKMV